MRCSWLHFLFSSVYLVRTRSGMHSTMGKMHRSVYSTETGLQRKGTCAACCDVLFPWHSHMKQVLWELIKSDSWIEELKFAKLKHEIEGINNYIPAFMFIVQLQHNHIWNSYSNIWMLHDWSLATMCWINYWGKLMSQTAILLAMSTSVTRL